MSTPKQRTVNLVVNLTEYEEPLPGSRAWLARLIETGKVKIYRTMDGAPAVFLAIAKAEGKKLGITFRENCTERSEAVAAYFAPFNYGDASYWVWPFCDTDWDQKLGTNEPYTLFGIVLRPAAEHLLCDFARKCRTLLKLRMRKEDAGSQSESLKVTITSA